RDDDGIPEVVEQFARGHGLSPRPGSDAVMLALSPLLFHREPLHERGRRTGSPRDDPPLRAECAPPCAGHAGDYGAVPLTAERLAGVAPADVGALRCADRGRLAAR